MYFSNYSKWFVNGAILNFNQRSTGELASFIRRYTWMLKVGKLKNVVSTMPRNVHGSFWRTSKLWKNSIVKFYRVCGYIKYPIEKITRNKPTRDETPSPWLTFENEKIPVLSLFKRMFESSSSMDLDVSRQCRPASLPLLIIACCLQHFGQYNCNLP